MHHNSHMIIPITINYSAIYDNNNNILFKVFRERHNFANAPSIRAKFNPQLIIAKKN